jgi:hypothetical protein
MQVGRADLEIHKNEKESLLNWKDYIITDPQICHGKACIKGTRARDQRRQKTEDRGQKELYSR